MTSNGRIDDTQLNVEDLRRLILDADDIDAELVEMPEWGGIRLEVRSMTGGQRAAHLKTSLTEEGTVNWDVHHPSILRNTVYQPSFDYEGRWMKGRSRTLVFAGMSDEEIQGRSARATERLVAAANRLSGSDNPAKAPEAVDEAAS